MRKKVREELKWKVARTSDQDKTQDLLRWFEPVKKDMQHQVCTWHVRISSSITSNGNTYAFAISLSGVSRGVLRVLEHPPQDLEPPFF